MPHELLFSYLLLYYIHTGQSYFSRKQEAASNTGVIFRVYIYGITEL